MNHPTTYEQLIAQKLQEMDVPDQANAIWATIEQQLSIEMPTDSGSGGTNHSNWWIGGGSLLTFTVAVITYLFITKQNFESERNLKDKPAPVQYHQPARNNKDTLNHTMPPIEIRKHKPVVVSETNERKETEQSSTKETVTISPAQKAVEAPAVPAPQPDTIATKKKSRGVKGISDADYRLVPSIKDSVKREN